MTALSELPTVIDAPGDYVTRDGRRVTIQQIRGSTPGNTAFTASGSVWTNRRGTLRARGQEIWHTSGRHRVLDECPLDIVARRNAHQGDRE